MTNELIEAAKNGDTEEVKRLLNAGADVNAKDEDGWTALMLAEENGREDSVKILTAATNTENIDLIKSALELAKKEVLSEDDIYQLKWARDKIDWHNNLISLSILNEKLNRSLPLAYGGITEPDHIQYEEVVL